MSTQYIANKSRIIVKAVGDFDYSRTDFEGVSTSSSDDDADGFADDANNVAQKKAGNEASADLPSSSHSVDFTKEYITNYKPKVIKRQWLLSETDLEFITIGCYILGTGGGGNPYQHFLRLREMLRGGALLRVISPRDLKDDDVVACGGGKGSPQVSIEKPYGNE